MTPSYTEAEQYINHIQKFAKKNTLSLPMHRPSLTRMTPLCTALPSPPMTGR